MDQVPKKAETKVYLDHEQERMAMIFMGIKFKNFSQSSEQESIIKNDEIIILKYCNANRTI